MKALLLWILITVTYGGKVHVKPISKHRAACEETLHVTLYGHSLAEDEKLWLSRGKKEYHLIHGIGACIPLRADGSIRTDGGGCEDWEKQHVDDVKFARCYAAINPMEETR